MSTAELQTRRLDAAFERLVALEERIDALETLLTAALEPDQPALQADEPSALSTSLERLERRWENFGYEDAGAYQVFGPTVWEPARSAYWRGWQRACKEFPLAPR